MRLFGLEIRRPARTRKTAPNTSLITTFPEPSRLWQRIIEPFAGAWQRNIEFSHESVLTYAAVYACVSLIASDIGKLRIKLVEQTSPGIWDETTNVAYSPVLRKPNHYQTHIQFLERWMTSKLIYGNTYIFKERDASQKVRSLYILDPCRVKALVAPDGSVFYDLPNDNLAGLNAAIRVPASEIIHDIMVPLYHDLCGVSPLSACGLAAVQGLSAQRNSNSLFTNGSRPSGILSSPGSVSEEEARAIQQRWQDQFSGENFGAVAVLGLDLKYQPMTMTAVDAQFIEQLKWTAENICTAFKVPAHKIGVGPTPTNNNIEALDQQYYSQCLQTHIEHIEVLLDEALGLAEDLGTELDLDGLMRMDTASRVAAAKEAANGGGMTFNEVRKRYHGVGPVTGGDVVLSQQQNFSLEALAKRDAREDPFAASSAQAAPPEMSATTAEAATAMDVARTIDALLRKELEIAA